MEAIDSQIDNQEETDGLSEERVEETIQPEKKEEEKQTIDQINNEQKIKDLEDRLQHKEDFIQQQRSENDKLKYKSEQVQKTQYDNNITKPDPNNYNDEQKYITDLVGWEVKQTNIQDTIQSEIRKSASNDKIIANKHKFDQKANILKKEISDFDNVAKSSTMLDLYSNSSNNLGLILENMDNGPNIAYYLGKNIDVAHSLSTLPPHELVPALLNIENQVKSKTTTKQNTNNIEPIKPLRGTNGAIKDKSVHEMTTSEWLAHKKKG